MPANRDVGPFEVIEPLGAGGMGEVFKARDRRLNRLVALKFLPEAATPAARERFQREATAIAALNHPHICTLFEIGDDHGRPYLVLELLEGETLRARLARGPLSPEQLLDWAVQIADALDAAHRRGILHRDLKPDNIWVSPGGHLKVLDFGLARLEAPDPSDAAGATLTDGRTLTSPGMTLGTIPYMSPEQARGETLDPRSDLFSFGSVFYEMACGRRAFPASGAADSIAAILKEQPPRLGQLRPELPLKFDEVASRCLEKDPDLRYQSAADLRSDLKRLKRESGTLTPAPASDPSAPATVALPAPPPRPSAAPLSSDAQVLGGLVRRHWRWPALAALALVAAALAWWRFAPRPPAAPINLTFRQLTFTGHVLDAAISPDGKFLAHVDLNPGGTSLHLLSIASGSDVQIVPPGDGCCAAPTFSPDGSAVYFQANDRLEAVPVLGGAVRPIASHVCSGAGFSPDGSQIAYLTAPTATSQLILARPDGAQPRVLHETAPGVGYLSTCWGSPGALVHPPAWSPDGRLLAVAKFGNGVGTHVETVNTADGHVADDLAPDLNFGGADLNWLPDGSGLVLTAAMPASAVPQAWLLPYPSGPAKALTNDLQGYSSASLSAQGDLVLLHNAPQYSIWAQASPQAELRQLPGGGSNQDGFNGLAWTPQDALVTTRTFGGKVQLWSDNADGTAAHPLLPDAPSSLSGPVVAPNGQILFSAGTKANDVWRVNADGTGLIRFQPAGPASQNSLPTLVDGGQAVVYLHLLGNRQTLWQAPLGGGPAHQIWSGNVFVDGNPASPDGNRLFAETMGPGQSHVAAIIQLDGGQAQVHTIALDHATMQGPYNWTPDGRAITYIVNHGTTDNLWAFPLDGRKPYPLTHFTDLRIAAYAFSHDGRLALSRGSPNTDAVLATGLAPANSASHAH
ncbi:MAG TPA: protein kinase [Terriglobales bacterium]|nr:protein kinase [Terriglobales bacterium]